MSFSQPGKGLKVDGNRMGNAQDGLLLETLFIYFNDGFELFIGLFPSGMSHLHYKGRFPDDYPGLFLPLPGRFPLGETIGKTNPFSISH